MHEPGRGEIWFGNLDPVRGHEQAGARPLLVVSVDPFNHSASGLVVVVPLTTKRKPVQTQVSILPPEGGTDQPGYIKCEDIRSITKDRLREYWGTVTDETMRQVEHRLKLLLGL